MSLIHSTYDVVSISNHGNSCAPFSSEAPIKTPPKIKNKVQQSERRRPEELKSSDGEVRISWKVPFASQAMRRRQADLWYPSSFGRSRSVETSRNSSLSSQHSWLAVELQAQHGRSSLRYRTLLASIPNALPFFALLRLQMYGNENKGASCCRMAESKMLRLNGAGAVVENGPLPFA